MLENIRIILCQPTHPGNIGSTARAMKNMGLSQLTLISPANYPDAQATSLASGADDILAKAIIVDTFEEAIQDCHWLFGTSARLREFPWPQLTPNLAAQKAITFSGQQQSVGIAFGTERSGLTNEALQRCDFHLSIPTHPAYPSLNLAQAVQVVTYEIYQAYLNLQPLMGSQVLSTFPKATTSDVAGLLNHFLQVAIKIGFMDPSHPKKLLPRLKRLFSKAQLEVEEINILRGFLKKVAS
ncbi:MAG: RNA methyltransferase [Proteobacteria bacterium]|nr:RNA methyltransferase [Pseudomonadota bacterium]